MRRTKKASERQPTHLTEDEFIRRHQYCITITEIQMVIRDTQKRNPGYVFKPDQMKAVCDHPEDGVCGYSISPEKLAEVNARLSGLNPVKQAATAFVAISEPTSAPKKRGRPRKTAVETPTYFCLHCNKRHEITHTRHLSFKRGRGRPRKA